MKLIIKHYLTMLKESKELDILLPDLLLNMRFNIISRPNIGTRQYGADVVAIDKERKKEIVYIFTIKQGNVTRSDWDSTPQSIRQSLDEIREIYIPKYLETKYRKKDKRIIVVTGGEMKQEIQSNWEGYTKKYSNKHLEFDFWGGDQLAPKIEKFLLNENILSSDLHSSFRKTLVFLEYGNYDELNKILNTMFISTIDLDILNLSKRNKEIIKRFRTINLMLNIMYYWSIDNKNIKPSLIASEKIIVSSWHTIKKYDLFKHENIMNEFHKIYNTLDKIYSSYYEKIKPYTKIKNGLCITYGDFTVNAYNLFEIIGFLGVYGFIISNHRKDNTLLNEIIETLKNCIVNHEASFTPCFDNQIIDIVIASLLIYKNNNDVNFLSSWFVQMINCICFAYNNNYYFPISQDSFNDLFEYNINQSLKKEDVFYLSTLIPTLLQLCCTFNFKKTYSTIQKTLNAMDFGECNFQIWYPNKDTENEMYKNNNNVLRTGLADTTIDIKIELQEMERRINLAQKNTVTTDNISTLKYGLDPIPLIVSRHYRMPVLPIYWQSLIINKTCCRFEE